ncbi:MAG TPA: hypothetical protein VFR24_27640 [Candidatus Angelobacter sp.]|nr:hypothetical protein [Candidatus Angelobacter sp.]
MKKALGRNVGVPSDFFLKKVGMTLGQADGLTSLNYRGKSFKQIALVIERDL